MSSSRDLVQTAWQARRDGRHDDAERDTIEAIALARRSHSRADLIRALNVLAHIVRDRGQNERALLLSEEAVALCREEADSLLLAHTVRHLGDAYRDAGRPIDADRCYSEALDLYRAAPEPPALDFANAMRPAALLKEAAGDIDAAKAMWSQARQLYEIAGVPVAVDECSRRLSRLA